MVDADDLAGIVGLFGALTRGELERALAELAYRRGEDLPADVIDDAVAAFALVAVDPAAVDGETDGAAVDDDELFVPGPAAFPTLPDGAEDLPHILEIEDRSVDRAAAGEAAEARFRAAAATAVADDDPDRISRLLDVSYDLEAWAPVELDAVRDRLDDAVADEGTN